MVEVGSEMRVLFSVRDKPDGGLNLTLMKYRTGSGDDGVRRNVMSQRYSIHTSPNSPTNSIHHTLVTDSLKKETLSITTAISSGLAYPVFASTFGKPGIGMECRERDRIISLGKIDQKKFLLHVVLFVLPKYASIDSVADGALYERRIVSFTNFSLIAVFCYSAVPTTDGSYQIHFGTGPERLDGAFISPATVHPGLPPMEAGEFAAYTFDQLHEGAIERARAAYQEGSGGHTEAVLDGVERYLEFARRLGPKKAPSISSDDLRRHQ